MLTRKVVSWTCSEEGEQDPRVSSAQNVRTVAPYACNASVKIHYCSLSRFVCSRLNVLAPSLTREKVSDKNMHNIMLLNPLDLIYKEEEPWQRV